MNRARPTSLVIAMQLLNAFLLLAFSVYFSVRAYPLVAFFQEREVTFTYANNVGVFVALGILALVGWWALRRKKLWGWLFVLSCDAFVCVFMSYDSLLLGLRETYFQLAAIALLSAVVVILLLMPDVRKYYSGVRSTQAANLG